MARKNGFKHRFSPAQNPPQIRFDRFVGEIAKCIEEHSSGSFVGLRGCSECDLKFSLGHL
jgi:hypothetical protein